MRLYDFSCENCNNIYEMLISKDSTPICKKCGSDKNQKKLISAPRVARATSNDQPRSQEDLANYFGSGTYKKNYKPSWVP